MLGNRPCPKHYHPCFNPVLPFDHRSTGLGQCGPRHSCRFFPATIREIGGYLREKACVTCEPRFVRCWRCCMWSKHAYVSPLVRGFAYSRYVFYLGRTMQGLACAGLIPAGIGILAALYQPGRRKNRVFSAFSAAQPLGGGIGSMYASSTFRANHVVPLVS